jgi:lipase
MTAHRDQGPVSGFVDAPDGRLHYVDWGGSGPPLVLVHATGFHARLWDPYAERLCDRFHVIAYDQRGHGDSFRPAGTIDWSQFADDLIAVIRGLDIAGCYAAGHSSGGAAAGVCAGLHQGSIRRALLIDPVLRADAGPSEGQPTPNPMAERTRRRRSVWDSPHQFEEAMRGRETFARWRPEFLSLYAHHGLRRRPDGHYELKCPPEIEAKVYEGAPKYDPWPALAAIRVPVLLLRAIRGQGGRPTAAPDAATRIPGCQERAIDAGHFVPMEQPEVVLAAMEEFFTNE